MYKELDEKITALNSKMDRIIQILNDNYNYKLNRDKIEYTSSKVDALIKNLAEQKKTSEVKVCKAELYGVLNTKDNQSIYLKFSKDSKSKYDIEINGYKKTKRVTIVDKLDRKFITVDFEIVINGISASYITRFSYNPDNNDYQRFTSIIDLLNANTNYIKSIYVYFQQEDDE